MNTRIRSIALVFLSLTICPGGPALSRAEVQPEVPFVLLRLDPETSQVLSGYGFAQPYRKSLQPPCVTVYGGCYPFTVEDVFILFEEPSDFGRTRLVSRLTGRQVFDATSVWSGTGSLAWPTAGEALPDLSRGPAAGEPALFSSWSAWYSYTFPAIARRAWESVRDLSAVSDLAAAGPYGVFVTDHAYGIPGRYEFLVLVYGKPHGPRDAGIVDVKWPQGLLADGVSTAPEVRLVNFSDESIDADVELEVLQGPAVVRRSRRSVTALPADKDAIVTFDPVVPIGPEPLIFHWKLAGSEGASWSDAFNDNDAQERSVDVVRLPVFRQFPAQAVPLNGFLIDFDDDGDRDVVRRDYNPSFLRNDAGVYVNITSRVAAPLPHWPTHALARDFTGDGLAEVLLSPVTLLTGDGTGGFRDITPASGLAGVGAGQLTPHDVDGDADLDLLTQVSGKVRLYLNDGSGRFTDGTSLSGIEPVATRGVSAVGQVSGDARPDLVITGWTVLSAVYEDLGGGRFLSVANLPDSKLSRHAAIFDYDRDGLPDIHLTGFNANRLFRQQSPLSFVDVSSTAGYMGGIGKSVPFDMDRDGWVDLAIDFPPRLVRNNHGVLEDESRLLIPRSTASTGMLIQPQVLDLDADGDDDLHYHVVAYQNLGLPRPTAGIRVERIASAAPAWLHLVIYGSPDLDVRALDRSSLTFGPGAAPPGHPGCPHLVDHDGDGFLDLLMHVLPGAAGLGPREAGCLDGALISGTLVRGCTGPPQQLPGKRRARLGR